VTSSAPELGAACGVAPPVHVIINISQHGCVTFFMKVDNLALADGVEGQHRPLLEDILLLIRSATRRVRESIKVDMNQEYSGFRVLGLMAQRVDATHTHTLARSILSLCLSLTHAQAQG
jgi:hypothetical protein